MVIITVGGNDANPNRNISNETFVENLKRIFEKTLAMDECDCIFQSYYAFVYDNIDPTYVKQFKDNMRAGIELAKEMGVNYIHHLPLWEKLQEKLGNQKYQELFFDDNLHLNALGNQLWAYQMLKNWVIPEHMAQAEIHFDDAREYIEMIESF